MKRQCCQSSFPIIFCVINYEIIEKQLNDITFYTLYLYLLLLFLVYVAAFSKVLVNGTIYHDFFITFKYMSIRKILLR